MKKKPINILTFKSPFFPSSNRSHHSKKSNNKFKKSSTSNYSTKTKSNNRIPSDNPIGINSINNNIYLNLFNKFNSNTSSIKHNMISPKEIISNRINNNQMNKMRKNLNLYEMPSSSIHNKNNKSTYVQPNLIDSMNFINNHGHINIRLNLKNQIINDINNNNISDYNINTGLDIAEKMKEKNNKIIQLQKDLLKSQEIIYDLNNENNILKYKTNNKNKNKNVANLNKSSREKNIFMLTKSSESVDKILKTAFNEYNLDNINNKKSNKKNHKNSFLKKSGFLNNIKGTNINNKSSNKNKNLKISDILYINNNLKNKKQNDYLRLFLPTSNFYKTKTKFNSYSNDRKNAKNKINFNLEYNLIKTDNNKKQQIIIKNKGNNNKNNNIDEFIKKCEYIKQKAKSLINNYIDLANYLKKSKSENI